MLRLIHRTTTKSLASYCSCHHSIPMAATAASLAHASLLLRSHPLKSLQTLSLLPLSSSFSSLSIATTTQKKSRRAVVVAAVDVGGVVLSREEVVRENDPTNNVPDSIYAKLGMQLHRRDNHPIGILKNAIFDYFDKNYPAKFDKFDDLFPIVSVKANGYCKCSLGNIGVEFWKRIRTEIYYLMKCNINLF